MQTTLEILLTNFVTTHTFIILVLVAISSLVCYHWKRRNLYFLASKIHGPFAWPLIGSALEFARGIDDVLTKMIELMDLYKPPMRVWFGPRLFIAISSPEHLEIVMNSPYALEKADAYKFSKPFIGEGLFAANATRWKRNRKIISYTFNLKILNSFIPIFEEQSKVFVKCLEKYVDCGVFDVYPFVNRCTLDIICETAIGVGMNSQTGSGEYLTWMTRLLELCYIRITNLWLHPDIICHRTKKWKEGVKLIAQLNEVACQMITRKRAEYKEKKMAATEDDSDCGSANRKAFLEHLIELSENGEVYTDVDILHEVNTLLVAGSDTSAANIGFTFVMLGMHPEVQDRVYTEVIDIFEGNERPIVYEDVSRMEYLDRVLKETMRLFPVGPIMGRSITEDIPLDTCTLPKGCECVFGIINTHRDPKLWPNPLEFNPDRFLPQEVSKRHPYSYVPFSGGPRNCVGIKYAMISMKIVMSTIVRSFKISTDYKNVADISIKAELIIRATNGCRIALEHRQKSLNVK